MHARGYACEYVFTTPSPNLYMRPSSVSALGCEESASLLYSSKALAASLVTPLPNM